MACPPRTPRRRGAAGALAAIALVLLPRTGHGFCRTTTLAVPPTYNPSEGCFTDGLPLFWSGACIGYTVNERASAVVPFPDAYRVITAAFATWSTRCTKGAAGIATLNLGAVTCAEVRYNKNDPNQNVVVFRDDGWPHNDPNSTLGLTTVTFNSETGEIYDADMEINATGKDLSTSAVVPANGFDLASIVTHEVGHFLGLAHATDAKATMYARYLPGTSALRNLTKDDVAGLCEIYPSPTERNVAPSARAMGLDVATTCDATPRHDFATTCEGYDPQSGSQTTNCAAASGPSPTPGWVCVAMATGLVGLLRRRTRAPHQSHTAGRYCARG